MHKNVDALPEMPELVDDFQARERATQNFFDSIMAYDPTQDFTCS